MCGNCKLVDGKDVSSEARFTTPRGPKDDGEVLPGHCLHPEDWHAYDTDSTEAEVLDMVGGIAKGLRPRGIVVETGSAFGYGSQAIGEALYGTQGRLISFEVDPDRVKLARRRVQWLPVEIRRKSSLEGLKELAVEHAGKVQLIFLDSLTELRPQEMELSMDLLAPGGWILVHDCGDPSGTKYPVFSTVMYDKAESLGLVGISAPTPRGFTIFARGA